MRPQRLGGYWRGGEAWAVRVSPKAHDPVWNTPELQLGRDHVARGQAVVERADRGDAFKAVVAPRHLQLHQPAARTHAARNRVPVCTQLAQQRRVGAQVKQHAARRVWADGELGLGLGLGVGLGLGLHLGLGLGLGLHLGLGLESGSGLELVIT